MSSIKPFYFNTYAVRTAVDTDGTPWFVAKDVAELLEYNQTSDALTHCKHSANLPELNKINGLPPATKWVPESDVNRMIMRSNMPKAVEIQDWVAEDVLPSIRRTGSYVEPTPYVDKVVLQLQRTEAAVKAFLNMAESLGTEKNMARVIAVGRARDLTGLDVTALLPYDISVPEKPMTPTAVGKLVDLTAFGVNRALLKLGMQVKDEASGDWVPTEAGKAHCTVNPYKSRTSEHTGYRILWNKSIVDSRCAEAGAGCSVEP